jgi:hypothetical protein
VVRDVMVDLRANPGKIAIFEGKFDTILKLFSDPYINSSRTFRESIELINRSINHPRKALRSVV